MMARESKIDEDCEQLSVVADPWNLKLKPAQSGFDHANGPRGAKFTMPAPVQSGSDHAN